MVKKSKIDDPGGVEFTFPGCPGLVFRVVEATVLDRRAVPYKSWAKNGRPEKARQAVDRQEYTSALVFVRPKAGRELDGWAFLGLANDSEFSKHWIPESEVEAFEEHLDVLLKGYDIDVDLCGS